ncbi:MAG: T9SS type A sorting domain-containing protein, partial [Deferribacteres bacterium]|nr:T9SS type A sorting domain-containing protein [Deferribacteres bacterium]
VMVTFSEEVEQVSAETATNYIIAGVTVQSASLQANNKDVLLSVESLNPEQSYVLVVTNIRDRSPSAYKMALQQLTLSKGLIFPTQINVGGDASDAFLADSIWDAFQEYGVVGGAVLARGTGVVTSENNDAAIYETAVNGLTFYQARVPNGRYDATLMFADAENTNAGERVFDVIVEEETAIDDLDIIAEAGINKALEKTIANIVVEDGMLDFYFKAETGTTTLSGLKIIQLEVSGVAEEKRAILPEENELYIYPNPFNPDTKIAFALDAAHTMELNLFDISGRFIKRLDHGFRNAGEYSVYLNTSGLSTGVYFICLYLDGKFVNSQKALYMK